MSTPASVSPACTPDVYAEASTPAEPQPIAVYKIDRVQRKLTLPDGIIIDLRSGITRQPLTNAATYATEVLSLASFLIVTGQMRYACVRLRPKPNNKGGWIPVYVFDDPANVGPELERRFMAGTAEAISPRALFTARTFLLAEDSHARSAVESSQPAPRVRPAAIDLRAVTSNRN